MGPKADGNKDELERVMRLHLAAAYNFARWLTHNDADAEDVLQEACVRVLKYSNTFRGENQKSWFMSIVRNTAFSWLKKNRKSQNIPLDENVDQEKIDPSLTFEAIDVVMLKDALQKLPAEFVEVLILKEIEGYSYEEISDTTGVPIGTVMSRLSRARQKLHSLLTEGQKGKRGQNELRRD